MEAYNFHHSIDFLILRATEKILNTKSLEKSKQHFYNDFSNDIGIINLLRQTYLKNGDLNETFEVYQKSRLEPNSYRYESLIATLIITIVGNIISGVLLDAYITNKDKIKKIINEDIISSIKNIPGKIRNKFLKGNIEYVKSDLEKVINCYVARLMNDKQLIGINSYFKLVDYFIYGYEIEEALKEQFYNFLNDYLHEENCINIDKLFEIIERESRGIYLKYLDESGCDILSFENIKSTNQINGYSVSPGSFKGEIIKVNNYRELKHIEINRDFDKKVLCFGGLFPPDFHDLVYNVGGVVTWNTGETGHLPVLCRNIGIPCVIIKESESKQLINNNNIIIGDGQCLIYT